jgi:hypothetical protein
MQCPADATYARFGLEEVGDLHFTGAISSLICHTPAPEPSCSAMKLPFNIGPPETTMAGTPNSAPISSDG